MPTMKTSNDEVVDDDDDDSQQVESNDITTTTTIIGLSSNSKKKLPSWEKEKEEEEEEEVASERWKRKSRLGVVIYDIVQVRNSIRLLGHEFNIGHNQEQHRSAPEDGLYDHRRFGGGKEGEGNGSGSGSGDGGGDGVHERRVAAGLSNTNIARKPRMTAAQTSPEGILKTVLGLVSEERGKTGNKSRRRRRSRRRWLPFLRGAAVVGTL
ncbi:hypothetical protein M0802_006836 [Mischocyttarus mexicanus]|nr:hypothetical protein M0802_006836 [Mischocyttarus mexicanus]